ncbi:MAG: threonine ammonia-lyase [Caulobacteraceae bacterium]
MEASLETGEEERPRSAGPRRVGLRDIRSAARRLSGRAVRTPLIASSALDERVRGRVFLKAETLQRIGAFKFRGAYNRLSRLSGAERKRGVVAFSSGNHAQGVALAAKLLSIPAIIVMPSDAPAVKLRATRELGAEVRLYDRASESREEIAAEIAAARGAILVPSFDDPLIIAGQGTVGLEAFEQATQAGARLDILASPIGGGGLMGGIAAALGALSPKTQLVGVEPEGFDDAARSLEAGIRVGAPSHPRSLCDSLETPMTGELTFPLLRDHLSGIVAVSDAEVAQAVRFAFSTLKLVVEPGGAAALAAALAGKLDLSGKTACLVLSGGNVDPDVFARILAREL